jgi:glutathionylspermidine synthase
LPVTPDVVEQSQFVSVLGHEWEFIARNAQYSIARRLWQYQFRPVGRRLSGGSAEAGEVMRRIAITPRDNIDARAKETGFAFAAIDGGMYWDERAYYGFSLTEIEQQIEEPTRALAALCVELAGRIVTDEKLLRRLAIPEHAWDLIADSFKRRDVSLYGRFDFSYDGKGSAKLLEYNADTPTALFEASVFQWLWLEDQLAGGRLPAGADQFNSIHEKLIARLAAIKAANPTASQLHLACDAQSVEDSGLIDYLSDCAVQAGFATYDLDMKEIGLSSQDAFVNVQDEPIDLLFKLYPWEWLFDEKFGRSPAMRKTRFIEPPWKAVLSNKGILPLLWGMAPGHPNLLESYFEDDPAHVALAGRFAKKPLYSREGSNIHLVDGARTLDRAEGPYGEGGNIVQALAPLPNCDGNYPVIGSWIIGDEACGMGIREDTSPITKNSSRFVPHAILP